MKLYGLKNCDTCRIALKSLATAGVEVIFIDVRAEGIPDDDLRRFLAAFGADLINRRSTTWRGLGETEREGAPLDLLRAHPTLMKRPVIDNGQLYLGWNKDVESALT